MFARRDIFVLSYLLLFTLTLAADNGPDHQIRLARPIRLGTSGGNNTDITRNFCCSGTLGALVQDAAGIQYILSNNHVIANNNSGTPGEPIGQPGLIDVNCRVSRADPVAKLSRFVRIVFNNANKVDAAIARVIRGKVKRSGSILDIGKPGSPVEARVGMRVKKSGRTTGRTVGQIIAINTSVRVDIERFCGDENGRTARFVDQFVVESTNSRPFTDSGDSGALIVKKKRTCPRSVGLLFAGDTEGLAIGNRIKSVLAALKVSIVGCASGSAAEGEIQGTRLDPSIMKVEQIRLRNEERLFRLPGIVGVGIGTSPQNIAGYTVILFVKKTSTTPIPSVVEGLPVRVIRTSGFKAR